MLSSAHDLNGPQGVHPCGYTCHGPQIFGAGDQGGIGVEIIRPPGIDPVPP